MRQDTVRRSALARQADYGWGRRGSTKLATMSPSADASKGAVPLRAAPHGSRFPRPLHLDDRMASRFRLRRRSTSTSSGDLPDRP